MRFGKKGAVLDEEVVKTIIAVAGVICLLIFIFLAIPYFDEVDKGSESYFEIFEGAIDEADKGREGSYFMIDNGKKNLNYYLVYFGGAASFSKEVNGKERDFRYEGGLGPHAICVCGEESEVVCGYCEKMKVPVSLVGANETWVIGEGVRAKVKVIRGHYVFEIE